MQGLGVHHAKGRVGEHQRGGDGCEKRNKRATRIVQCTNYITDFRAETTYDPDRKDASDFLVWPDTNIFFTTLVPRGNRGRDHKTIHCLSICHQKGCPAIKDPIKGNDVSDEQKVIEKSR